MTTPTVTASSSDATLIAAVRAGNAAAYGVLYERHAAAARSAARRLVRAATDTDDVVAETFTRVLSAIKNGAGPVDAFRPYLLTSVRRVAFDFLRSQRSQVPTDEADIPDPGELFTDLAVENLERSLVARAFWSLPERWSAVLWHTEVEQSSLRETAALLGLTPNGVAALSYRAREGLRQAYLQFHLSAKARAECQPIAAKLGAHVRGGLSRRDARAVDNHLSGCADCRAAHAELATINVALRGALAPVFLGGAMAWAGAGSAAHAGAGSAAHAGAAADSGAGAGAHGSARAGGRLGAQAHRLRAALQHHPVAQVAAALAATALLIPSSTVLPFRQGPGHGAARPGQASGSSGVHRVSAGLTGAHRRGSAAAGTPRSSPGHSSSPSPTSQPSSGPSPSPSASAPPLTAKLGVTVSVLGLLQLGVATVVDVQVSDLGKAPTKALTVTLALPPGISLVSAGSAGWSCSQGAGGSSCSGGPLGPGAASTVSFQVVVINLNACGDAIIATAVSGSLTASGQAPAKCLL